MDRNGKHGRDSARNQNTEAETKRPTPGKVTRTSKLPAPTSSAVQRRAAASDARRAAQSPEAVRQTAARGVSGSGGRLPHHELIQQSFGHAHDLSNVQAHVGGQAAAASADIGAQAYATGERIAFRDTPDLHTAAHEAAHVVQQRAGVSLSSGVGQAGDAYERHADAVADRVVRGESAAPLLEPGTGAGGSNTVQRLDVWYAANPEHEKLEVRAGELTALGEGNDAATKYIHWPDTDTSGVTLGKGYDIGGRSAEAVIADLIDAGMSDSQARKIAAGAGLTGQEAKAFVIENKDDIGEIDVVVQHTLLGMKLEEYTERARETATSTEASDNNRNAAGQEREKGDTAGTYVMSDVEWDSLHPAMVEFLTDLIYQGGYYGWDRVAKINTGLKANHDNHLEQFKAVRELFSGDYMDAYAERIGESDGRSGASEKFYGQTVDLEGEYRRNQIRLAYLNHIISALESGREVRVLRGGDGNGTGEREQPEVSQGLPEVSQGGGGNGMGGDSAMTSPASLSAPEVEVSGPEQLGPRLASPPQSDTVQAHKYTMPWGENLGKLASRFGVSIAALKQASGENSTGDLEQPEQSNGLLEVSQGGGENETGGDSTVASPASLSAPEAEVTGSEQPGPRLETPSQSDTAQAHQYVVQWGENLSILAAKFGVSITALKQANADKLHNWDGVEGFFAGASITIPDVATTESARLQAHQYVVQWGENLGILASKFGVSITALKQANTDKLHNWDGVEGFLAGATISIPGMAASEPAAHAPETAAPAVSTPSVTRTPTDRAVPTNPTSATARSAAPDVRTAEIQASVGAGGVNKARDVRIVQRNLIHLGYLDDNVEADIPRHADPEMVIIRLPETILAIRQYQEFGLGYSPDGLIRVGTGTWRNMRARLEMIQGVSEHQIETQPISPVLSTSQWISQFVSLEGDSDGRGLREEEKSYNGKPNKWCCWDAAQAMVKQAGGQLTHEVSSRLPTLLQQNGEARVLGKQAELGVKYIDKQLLAGKPTMLGVDNGAVESYNADKTTEHFIVIVGKIVENGEVYYRYFDPGTHYGLKGYSENNRLHLGTDYLLSGKDYSGTRDYRMSQVRQNS